MARCVVGSVAVAEPERVAAWIDEFGTDRIVLALDVTIEDGGPMLATHGWTKSAGVSLWDLLDRYAPLGARHLLCTDIGRDGALTGPNIDLYRQPDLITFAHVFFDPDKREDATLDDAAAALVLADRELAEKRDRLRAAVTEAYKKAPRTNPKDPSEWTLAGKWEGYTPPPMPEK